MFNLVNLDLKYNIICMELLVINVVDCMSVFGSLIISVWLNMGNIYWFGCVEDEYVSFVFIVISVDYFLILEIDFVEGCLFCESGVDILVMIVNEVVVKCMGLEDFLVI